jgi:hypothetical protein
MWAMLKTLLVQGILAKTLLRSFGWLAWLLPAGFLLKWVGLPILSVLGVLAVPVLIGLFVIGLPVFLVLVVGGALMALVGFLLTVAIALAKILIPIALVVWLVRWLFRTKEAPQAAPVEPSAA